MAHEAAADDRDAACCIKAIKLVFSLTDATYAGFIDKISALFMEYIVHVDDRITISGDIW